MKTKRFLLELIVFVVMVILFSSSSYAATGIVITEAVRIRTTPSTDSKIITIIYEDDKVDVIAKEGDWYKVTNDGKEGYVYSKYLKVTGEISDPIENSNEVENEEPEETIETSNEAVNEPSKAEINVSETYILKEDSYKYILPLYLGKMNEKIDKGKEVKVVAIANNWVYVQAEYKLCWIPKTLIEYREEEQSDNSNNDSETNGQKIGYVNVEKANLREGASTKTEPIETLTLNTEVKILGEENNWYKVEVDGKNGYVSKTLISDKKSQVPTSRSSTYERNVEQKRENNENDIEVQEGTTENIDETIENESGVTGEQIVEYAKKFLGIKYKSAGSSPETGFDCSGFTTYVYAHFGYSLNRTSSGQAQNGVGVSKSALQPGDILVFQNYERTKIGHVGIYIGNNQFIHSENSGTGVTITSVDSNYYSPRYVCSRRIL